MVITPHYTGTDPQALATALVANIKALSIMAANPQFQCDIYDALGPAPHHPLATAVNAGTTPTSTLPRETAVCLSYYATVNQPRKRGRVYLPAPILGNAAGARLGAGDVTRMLTFGPALFKNLPSGHVPVVFSRTNVATYPITNYWVDNEWDTVRSRGLVATTRSLGTVP
jgi:hypothetical protein